MKSILIRKIDELGRIVLPKELRKYLNINSGDDLQITVNDEKITLEKYSILSNYEKEIYNVINCFSNVTNYNIYIEISGKLLNYNETIDEKLYSLITERKLFYCEESKDMYISKSIKIRGKTVINPIVLNSDLLGSIIIVSNNDINQMINISKIINLLIKNILN